MRRTVLLAIVAASVLVPTARVAAEQADDKAIAQQIGAGLKQSGQLHDYRIGVKYQNGVAHLSGTVVNQQQMATAMRLAQSMNGVEHVVNDLSIDGGAAAAGSKGGSPDLGSSLRMASQQAPRQARPMINQASMPAAAPIAAVPIASAPMQRTRPMNMQPRNNMPMPMQQQGMPPMRPAMPQQGYASQASCRTCGPGGPGGPGMGMGGPGMGSPDMGGMSQMSAMGPGPGQMPMGNMPTGGVRAASYDNASMPGYAWPSYASYPNYAAVTYPQQYSPSAWPYIGPFYPYPQVPLGWRKVALEWDDGWWFLDFSDCGSNH